MSQPWRTLRFDLPVETAGSDVDTGDPAVRMRQTGFRLASARGELQMAEGDAAIRQAILLLVATRRGERVMRPDYGTDLDRLVFSPSDDTTAGIAIHYVREAITRWEPRVELLRVDAERRADRPGVLFLELDYRIVESSRTDHLSVAVDLTGSD